MATKRVQFFATLDELLLVLCRVVNKLNLRVFMYRGKPNTAIKQVDCQNMVRHIQQFGASRLYLSDSEFKLSEINPTNLEPGRLGMLQVVLPRKTGQVLLMSEISIKTDWVDSSTGERCQNPQLTSLFKQVKAELLKGMMDPVLGENLVTGRNSVYSTIKYTQAAKAFVDGGGQLAQDGVNNVRFRPIVRNTD